MRKFQIRPNAISADIWKAPPANALPAARSKRAPARAVGGHCRVRFTQGSDGRLTRLEIELLGELSKLPSISNSRILWVDKRPLFRIIDAALSAMPAVPTLRAGLVAARKCAFAMRAINAKNPEYVATLKAMSVAYSAARERAGMPLGLHWADTGERRLFALILCGQDCNRMDSHNVLKAACDWLEEIGIIRNDRNVDALALRKTQFMQDASTTTIVLQAYEDMTPIMDQLIGAFGYEFASTARTRLEQPSFL